MKSIPANSIPASTPNPGAPDNKKAPQLSEAAVMLLPGLHHAARYWTWQSECLRTLRRNTRRQR